MLCGLVFGIMRVGVWFVCDEWMREVRLVCCVVAGNVVFTICGTMRWEGSGRVLLLSRECVVCGLWSVVWLTVSGVRCVLESGSHMRERRTRESLAVGAGS